LRDEDGSCWFTHEKWGTWLIVDDESRSAVVGWIRRAGRPLGQAAAGRFDDALCAGVAIDLRARRYRGYPCYTTFSVAGNESADRRIREAGVWAGWDVGFAWGGREELADVIPQARPVVAPYRMAHLSQRAPAISSREGWFAGWDPARLHLTVSDDPCSADWYDPGDAFVSVVRPDLTVLDYRLDTASVGVDDLIASLRCGPSFADRLLAEAPFPVPGTDVYSTAGVVIDMDQRALGYWTKWTVPATLLSDLGQAWPGWRIHRIRYGLAGHLTATGRRYNEPASEEPAGVDPRWIAERGDLPTDRRALRHPVVRVA
jgi:hypothetical protein